MREMTQNMRVMTFILAAAIPSHLYLRAPHPHTILCRAIYDTYVSYRVFPYILHFSPSYITFLYIKCYVYISYMTPTFHTCCHVFSCIPYSIFHIYYISHIYYILHVRFVYFCIYHITSPTFHACWFITHSTYMSHYTYIAHCMCISHIFLYITYYITYISYLLPHVIGGSGERFEHFHEHLYFHLCFPSITCSSRYEM